MLWILIEFLLSFMILSNYLQNISTNTELVANVLNNQIEDNYNNVYHSYLYNLYQDSFDSNYFEKALDIANKDCDIDNDWNWQATDNIDGCPILFIKTDKIYKYEWKVIDFSSILWQLWVNQLIPGSFLTVRKEKDKYIFNTWTKKEWKQYNEWSFIIEKNK